ncbi:MAG: STAS domain-containing protein, partial [Candidatus Obscuribacterales bacterium]|nr:STAS domain-containing protein [Candidatus Obscuribacterales bacterium]
AGLVVVVVEIVQSHGIESLGLIILLAGAMQLAAGQFGLGQWFRAVPPSVVHGMLSGIGLLLLSSQFHVMLDDTPKASAVANIISIPIAIWEGLAASQIESHHLAAVIGVSTILIIIIWDKLALGKHIPGALVAIVLVTIIEGTLNLPIKHVAMEGGLLDVIKLPGLNSFSHMTSSDLLLNAVVVAFIASCETMLTCTAIDRMAIGQRTKYDQELKAQGVGNMLCGFLGILPMTGVIVRSGVNVRAGAKTRVSTMLHGFWLILFVVFLPFIVELIPVSSLAALLVLTGYKLLHSTEAKELKQYGKSQVLIWGATVASIVLIDLLTGVLIGVILSISKLLYDFSLLEIHVEKEAQGTKTNIHLSGAATFLSLPKLAQAIENVSDSTELHVHLEGLDYIDHACLETIMNWDKQHRAQGGSLVIDWGILGAMFRERRKIMREKTKTRIAAQDTYGPES